MMQTRVHRARPNEDSFISRLVYKRKFRRVLSLSFSFSFSNLSPVFSTNVFYRIRALLIVQREYGN